MEIVKCNACGWSGEIDDLRKEMMDADDETTEPDYYCPNCDSDDLDEINQ